jgi:nucleotide-binding universal stress UspA family protein
LAQRNRAQLIVFHAASFPSVWQIPCELDAYYQWEQIASKFKMDRLIADRERKVKSFVCERLKVESNGVTWKPRVTLGRAADEIVTAALQEEVDLIVMDRRQRSPLAQVFTHGILEKVSRSAPCPVLLIDAAKSVKRVGGWRMPVLEQMPSY